MSKTRKIHLLDHRIMHHACGAKVGVATMSVAAKKWRRTPAAEKCKNCVHCEREILEHAERNRR